MQRHNLVRGRLRAKAYVNPEGSLQRAISAAALVERGKVRMALPTGRLLKGRASFTGNRAQR